MKKKRKQKSRRSARPKPPAPAVQRRAGGQWTPGTSGNPTGRPRKNHSLAEQLRRAVDGPHRQRIIKQLVTRAEEGHLPSIELVMRYVVGVPRGAPLVAIDARSGNAAQGVEDLNRLSVAELMLMRDLMLKASGQDVQPQTTYENTPAVVMPPAEVVEVPAVPALPPPPEETTAPMQEPEPIPPNVVAIDAGRSDYDVLSKDEQAAAQAQRQEGVDDLTRPSTWKRNWSA